MNEAKGAALYIRVSTQEQARHGLSTANQRKALEDYCHDHAIAIFDIYDDSGISGHASYKKRPALLRMISDCQQGKISIILFTRIDRYFRSIKDYYLVSDQIGSVPWRAIWEDYETETSSGQLKVNIMLSVAEAEASRTSEKIRSVFDYKRERGDYVGSAPVGYKRQDNRLVKDHETAWVAELIFRTYQQTGSSVKTSQVLQEHGRKSSATSIRRILRSETYCGNACGTSCEPYITREEHEAIIRELDRKRAPRDRRYVYMFTGLLVCGYCGNRMRSKNSGKSHCKHYQCPGNDRTIKHDKSVMISEKKLEAQLLDKLEPMMAEYNARGYSLHERKSDSEIDVEKIKARLSRVRTLYEMGDIEIDEYKVKKAELTALISKAEREQQAFRPVTLPDTWREMYADLSIEGKRRFWHGTIDHITVTRENRYSLSAEDVVFL